MDTTTPFTFVYLNINSFPPDAQDTWTRMVSPPPHNPPLPDIPLLYAFTETSSIIEARVKPTGWNLISGEGTPRPAHGHAGGGISLLYHTDCPTQQLQYLHLSTPTSPPVVTSSAVLLATVRPRLREPFLLATVYLSPHEAVNAHYISQITAAIDACSNSHPLLPLVVVGDFNSHHAAWHQPPPPGAHTTACARAIVDWTLASSLHIHNPDKMYTRVIGSAKTIIDLVLTDDPLLVSSITQRRATELPSDHRPFTITLELLSTDAPAYIPDDRPRETWDQHTNAEMWQHCLPELLDRALRPLQPALLSLSLPLPAHSSPAALLEEVYNKFEGIFLATCRDIVGTRLVRPRQVAWFKYPGIRDAYNAQRRARYALRHHPSDPVRQQKCRAARAAWAALSSEARLQSYSELCQSIMSDSSKLRWSLFKRTAPSTFTSLAFIADANNVLPSTHAGSLSNLAAAFIANGVPSGLPSDIAAYNTTVDRVSAWADPAHPAIEPHHSDSWTFTPDDVEAQCTRQHVNTAPGPDSLLAVFLKYAGKSGWAALSTLYNFSWRHSVTPLAWREANVMALYKGDGDKSSPENYRPLSMTSIVARTFEHLVHWRLMAILDPPLPPNPAYPPGSFRFAHCQFGFRKNHRTIDSINYLLTGIQLVTERKDLSYTKKPSMLCPVLFLDLAKAFDRVDHALLLQRVHDAGITGRAWLWIRSFLTGRRMRTVDSNEHSEWLPVQYGVPQGCVLSPLLFLLFIDQLAKTIPQRCPLLSAVFYADDGAIGPNSLKPWTETTDETYTPSYLKQLQRAITLLDRWCDQSRMQFGQKKTQLVLFSTRKSKTLDSSATAPYASFQLCGFTISIAKSYRYLGVVLHETLRWSQQQATALRQARTAAQRVTRVALRSTKPHLPSIRALVLGYLIPVFSYAMVFWGSDFSSANWRSYQSCVSRPLRVALNLPTTTHQTGVLHLCGIPSLHSLYVKAQLSHFHRVTAVLPLSAPSHPTLLLHRACLTGFRPNNTPANLLSTDRTLTLALRLAAETVPSLLASPTIQHLPPDLRQSLVLPAPPAQLGALTPTLRCAHYFSLPTAAARKLWTKTSGNFTLTHLKAAILHASAFAASLTSLHIHHLVRWIAVDGWAKEHAPGVAHATTAPLTTCKPSPGIAFHLLHDSPSQARRRARLLLNRARTGEIQARFYKTGTDAVDPNCTHPACSPITDPPTPGTLETVGHMLLECPRHTPARQLLHQRFNQLIPPIPLSLSSILLASTPTARKADRLSLISSTNTFLDMVEADRAGLLPLDTG